MSKELKFQKVEKPYEGGKDVKLKNKPLDSEEHSETEYVCTGQNAYGIRTYAVRKVGGEVFSK